MAWNEPGGNGDKDPWGNRGNQGPPDLDEVFRNFQRKFGSLFGGKGGRGGGRRAKGGSIGIGIVIAIVLVFWMATGFYKIEEAERGIILRFGKHVDTTLSGLHWHWPTPIESVTKVDVTRVTPVPLRATMLTQDENIVDIEGTIQYQVADATAFLFNVSRGAIVDEEALVDALSAGRIAGAGLDVFSQEPLAKSGHPMSALYAMDNVILTPHLTFYTAEAMRRLEEETLARCRELLTGEPVLVKSDDPRLTSQRHGVVFPDAQT